MPVVSEQEAEDEAQEDIKPENETEPQAYDQRHYTTLATFFADKGGKGLGFMQQLLLRRQSEQLFGLIKTLDALIDPTAGEEKAINETNNIIKEQEEKPVVLDQEEKRKLKSRLLGLLSLLKSLKTLSKAYEENLTRTSLDPRYDGSSLKRRLDSMLPDVQDSISEIIESINEFTSQKKELQEQKNKDPERQEKIDLVSDVYKDMRVIWQTTLGDTLSKRLKKEEKIDEQEDVQQTETVEASAKAMRDLATNPEFIKLFPTSRLTQSGEVVSIEEANKALTGVISEFIYVMRNVVALVKGENVTPETAKEVKSKLVDIAEAIENYFGAPAGKLAKEAEKEEASEPSSQSLTDTPLLPPPSTPDSVEWEEDEDFGFDDTEETDEFSDMSPEQESRTLEKEVEKFSKFIEREEGTKAKQVIFAGWVEQLLSDVLPKDYEEDKKNKIWIKTLLVLRKAFDKELVMEAITQKDVNTVIRDIPVYLKSNNIKDRKEILKLLQKLIEGGSMLELLKIINSRDVKDSLKKVIKFDSQEKSLEEALKPIIAKMLKEYHG